MEIIIIGAGITGLRAAHRLLELGHRVTVVEKDAQPGGMASSVEIEPGKYLERFYHFICLTDKTYFRYIEQLGLKSKLHFRKTRMGIHCNGTTYSFGNPLELLTFPVLSPGDRLKFGFGILRTKYLKDWKSIQNLNCEQWGKKMFGEAAYSLIYEPLLRLKFDSYRHLLSASWLWARIARLARSRTRFTLQEKIAYLENGTHTLISAMVEKINHLGGKIITNTEVLRIVFDRDRIRGVKTRKSFLPASVIISTVPVPAFLNMVPERHEPYFKIAANLRYLGIVCPVFVLEGQLSPYFWLNISNTCSRLTGIIEYSNLNPGITGPFKSIVYVPTYIHPGHENFSRSDEVWIQEAVDELSRLFPGFSAGRIKQSFVFREKFAQPVCKQGFDSLTLPLFSGIKGLYVTDASQFHPHDRTVNNSLRLGEQVAGQVIARRDKQ